MLFQFPQFPQFNSSGLNARHCILSGLVLLLCIGLALAPTGFEERIANDSLRCKAEVLSVDNTDIKQFGMIKTGSQDLQLKLLSGSLEGTTVPGENRLLGQLDKDKLFVPGDTALVVLSLDEEGNVQLVNPQDHYRLDLELLLLGLFALLLVVFGGWTGLKALLSFIFTGLMIWKVLVPLFLRGYDPVLLSIVVVAVLTAVIIFLVAGVGRMGITAFLGAFLGISTSCALALHFTAAFHIHGATMPFSETLLYSGFGHLDLARIYIAAVFLAASGAVMDLAMDVAAAMQEVVDQNPSISRRKALFSGLRVGRAVVGTMTTTLLLAYSGGFITLLMTFMAQGVPLSNMFNMVYVAVEVLKTLVGSFGLVTVAPFTAVMGAFILVRAPEASQS